MDPVAQLLVVEDDPQLATMLTELLTGEGYAVELARDGQRGLHLGLTRDFDLMLLDRGLPAIEGLDLLTRLRARGRHVPTLVLSALGQPSDRVDGLDAGAEDYLGKPFDVDELLARLRGLLRRPQDHVDVLRVPGGELDISSRSVATPSGEVTLSEREAKLLCALARSPRRVFSRQELLESVFESAEDEGVVDTYVHYLRRKLHRGVVATVRGLGYRLGNL
ncbi:response regulator transcription factor [Nocardioides jensenii]|uniref:response regulator transcription factor n=1 Tax=Nocardioides jensenii TaxID=1843 RepID=UPI000AF73863|nr:response regulator transcription factor [Nocardioides jensenii]